MKDSEGQKSRDTVPLSNANLAFCIQRKSQRRSRKHLHNQLYSTVFFLEPLSLSVFIFDRFMLYRLCRIYCNTVFVLVQSKL
jgi:hypothetical protein